MTSWPLSRLLEKGMPNGVALLRLILALLVVLSHQVLFLPSATQSIWHQRTFLGEGPGGVAVAAFFVLSGFLISASWERTPSISHYLTRRVLRIMPALAVVTLLTALVLGPIVTTLSVQEYWSSPGTWHYLNTLLLEYVGELPGVFTSVPYPTHAVNAPLWSLRYEVLMYLLLPLVLFRGRKLIFALCLGGLVGAIFTYGLPSDVRVFHFEIFRLLAAVWFFFVGSLAYLYRDQVRIPALAGIGSLVLLVVGMTHAELRWLILFVLPVASLWLATLPADRYLPWFRKHDLSYGVYILSFPIQHLVASNGGTQLAFWDETGVVVTLCLLAAFASWKLVEAPALRRA